VTVRRPAASYSSLLTGPFAAALLGAPASYEIEPLRLSVAFAHDLLRRAEQATGDRTFGLKAGRMSTLGDAGALDFAVHAASSVQEALETAARFIRLVNGELTIALESRGPGAFVRIESRTPQPAIVEDFMMTALYSVYISQLLPAEAQVACWFMQRQPDDPTAHQAAFAGAQLRFACAERGFAFDCVYLRKPLKSANAKLYRILDRYLQRDLRELPEAPTYTERVCNLLRTESPMRTTTLPLVAHALGLSSRTLTRRLSSEGSDFVALLDDVRKSRAMKHLEQGDLSNEHIAKDLGFSRAPAFQRAFLRWTGSTPAKYRKARF
jgi:AraC-like DNA-binding protein